MSQARLHDPGGFSLIELMVVVGIAGTIMATAVLVAPGAIRDARADGGMTTVVTALRRAKDLAVTERRDMEVRFVAPNEIQIWRLEVPAAAGQTMVRLGAPREQHPVPGDAGAAGHAGRLRQRECNRVRQRARAHLPERGHLYRCKRQPRSAQRNGLPGRAEPAGHRAGGHGVRADRAHPELPLDGPAVGRMMKSDAGFSLLRRSVALMIVVFGLMTLAQVFVVGMTHMSTSTYDVIAREKAREAVESVHTARDTRTITWAQIRNVSGGGVFLDGAQPASGHAGNEGDGLVNTADDGALPVQFIVTPGRDQILGTADDVCDDRWIPSRARSRSATLPAAPRSGSCASSCVTGSATSSVLTR